MTWEWSNGLRGYMYPALFASVYKFLAMFGLDNRLLLVNIFGFSSILCIFRSQLFLVLKN